jgi:ribosomal protein S18 acetylase RimI-like enzyme
MWHGTIRRLDDDALVDALTELLHRAYAELDRAGMRFHASWQDAATTRERLAGGECWIASCGAVMAGTVTYRAVGRSDGCAWYERPDVASFGQLAVDLPFRGRGLGEALMDLVERRAREDGAREIALDTAETAFELIETYRRRGYRVVGEADWRPITHYRSVVLSKALG